MLNEYRNNVYTGSSLVNVFSCIWMWAHGAAYLQQEVMTLQSSKTGLGCTRSNWLTDCNALLVTEV